MGSASMYNPVRSRYIAQRNEDLFDSSFESATH
jgi:hypothetical protein